MFFQAAVKAFYNLVFTGNFGPIVDSDHSGHWDRVEMEPFMIEMPVRSEQSDKEIAAKLKAISRVNHLELRRMPKRNGEFCTVARVSVIDLTERVVVSAVGQLEAVHRLRQLLAVKPNTTVTADCRERSVELTGLVYEKIILLPDPSD